MLFCLVHPLQVCAKLSRRRTSAWQNARLSNVVDFPLRRVEDGVEQRIAQTRDLQAILLSLGPHDLLLGLILVLVNLVLVVGSDLKLRVCGL